MFFYVPIHLVCWKMTFVNLISITAVRIDTPGGGRTSLCLELSTVNFHSFSYLICNLFNSKSLLKSVFQPLWNVVIIFIFSVSLFDENNASKIISVPNYTSNGLIYSAHGLLVQPFLVMRIYFFFYYQIWIIHVWKRNSNNDHKTRLVIHKIYTFWKLSSTNAEEYSSRWLSSTLTIFNMLLENLLHFSWFFRLKSKEYIKTYFVSFNVFVIHR